MPSRRRLLAAGLGLGLGLDLGLGAGLAPRPAFAQEILVEPVVETPWSGDGLFGTLAAPQGGGRGLGVLILAGSGPTDRNGNGPGLATDLYRKLAHGLAAAGHVVLRYDKRGVGESRALVAREEDITFPLLEEDARAALRALKARPDVRGVVPLGHSEGAMIAIRLAGREQVSGLVLMAAPGRTLAALLTEQFAAAGAPPGFVAQAQAIMAKLARGERVGPVPASLAALFRPSVQPYLISSIAIDPAEDLARVAAPTLILSAGRDLQVGEKDLDALKAARPAAQARRLAQANHVFKTAPEDRAGNIALYQDAAAPLDPGVLPALLAFLAGLG